MQCGIIIPRHWYHQHSLALYSVHEFHEQRPNLGTPIRYITHPAQHEHKHQEHHSSRLVSVGHSNKRKEKKGQIPSYDGKDNQPVQFSLFATGGWMHAWPLSLTLTFSVRYADRYARGRATDNWVSSGVWSKHMISDRLNRKGSWHDVRCPRTYTGRGTCMHTGGDYYLPRMY